MHGLPSRPGSGRESRPCHDGCRSRDDTCTAGVRGALRRRRDPSPVLVGSIADTAVVTSRTTTVEEVNEVITEEAPTARYAGVLGVSRDPLVSSDVVGDPRASVIGLDLKKVVDGDLVRS